MKNAKNTFLRWIKIIGIFFFIIVIVPVILSNYTVETHSKGKLYTSIETVPENRVGLLLGTSKYIKNGNINRFYKYRIDAAVELFNNCKIEYIIVSGDNGTIYYNEPQMMLDDLLKRGIPREKVFLDYAGFRTLDSVVRCYEIFGQKAITVISQEFHNERAIFIAASKGMDAIGFNAESLETKSGIKTYTREYLARVKMLLDLYVMNVQPKYLGEKILI